jgi:hypothetical protein
VTDSTDDSTLDAVEEIDSDGLGPAVMASVGSVLLALYFYYVRGDKQRGQFIGLWPATILGLASYFKLREIRQALAKAEN